MYILFNIICMYVYILNASVCVSKLVFPSVVFSINISQISSSSSDCADSADFPDSLLIDPYHLLISAETYTQYLHSADVLAV